MHLFELLMVCGLPNDATRALQPWRNASSGRRSAREKGASGAMPPLRSMIMGALKGSHM